MYINISHVNTSRYLFLNFKGIFSFHQFLSRMDRFLNQTVFQFCHIFGEQMLVNDILPLRLSWIKTKVLLSIILI